MQLLGGFQVSQAVYVVAERGVATILEKEAQKTVAEFAEPLDEDGFSDHYPIGQIIETPGSGGSEVPTLAPATRPSSHC